MTYVEDNKRHSIFNRLPREQQDWHDKWHAVDAVMNDIGGVVTRVGDETVGEMWSLYDGRDVLNEIDPQFGDNIARHIQAVIETDVFHVSANTDPKGDRSKAPQDQDPDMMVHVVKETDAGIIIRGAKYETASGYADQGFLKPTVGAWTNEKLSDYAVGCIVKMGAPGVKHIAALGLCRHAPAPRTIRSPTVRRGRLPDGARQRPDPLGGRVLLSLYHGRAIHPRHAASLFGIPLHAARSLRRRHDDRCGDVERQADRPRQAAGGARETRRSGLLPRGHQRASDGRRSPLGADEPRRAADAAPVDALCRPRLRLREPAANDAHRARAVRRPDLRHARTRPPSSPQAPGSGWRNSTASTTIGRPRTAASCSPSRATC